LIQLKQFTTDNLSLHHFIAMQSFIEGRRTSVWHASTRDWYPFKILTSYHRFTTSLLWNSFN